MIHEQFLRTQMLLGTEALERLQAQAHHPDSIQALPPGILDFFKEIQLLQRKIHAEEHLGTAVFPGHCMFFHMQMGNRYLLTIALYHQIVVITGIQGKNQ